MCCKFSSTEPYFTLKVSRTSALLENLPKYWDIFFLVNNSIIKNNKKLFNYIYIYLISMTFQSIENLCIAISQYHPFSMFNYRTIIFFK